MTVSVLLSSPGDEPPCDTQSTDSWTEALTSSLHSQPPPRVPRPSHLHQNTSESELLFIFISEGKSQKAGVFLPFFNFSSFNWNLTWVDVFPDVQRADVRVSSFEGESSQSEKRRWASAHAIHGKDGRNAEPFQRWHHHLPAWVRFYGNICIRVSTCSFLLKWVWICVCRQSSQPDPAQFHISVPSCPRNWSCRVSRKRIHPSRTTKRTARTRRGTS